MNMLHINLYYVRSNSLILFFLLFGTSLVRAQDTRFPAIIAINRDVGFILDSAELDQNNLFTNYNSKELSYLVIIQRSVNDYDINMIYKDARFIVVKADTTKIFPEFSKLHISKEDTSLISDYAAAKLIYNSQYVFLVLDSMFAGKPYSYKGIVNTETDPVKIFLELNYKFVSMLNDVEINAFHSNVSLLIDKILLSANWSIGKSYRSETLNYFINAGPDVEYKYTEFSLTGGYAIVKSKVLVTLFSGLTGITYRVISIQPLTNSIIFNTFSKNEIEKEKLYGIPLGINFSYPATTALGLSIKMHTTFIFDGDPVYALGIGMRIGRASDR